MIRVSLFVSGAVLRRGLEGVLREVAAVEVVESTGWPPPEDLRETDVIIVGAVDADMETVVESLPNQDQPPAILLLSDDPVFAGGWTGLPIRALGVLPTAVDEDELAAAIAALERGLSVWHQDLLPLPETRPVGGRAGAPAALPDEIEPLTDRELEVLQLLAFGFANKRIALQLSISEHTVKFHISSIYGKMGAGNRTEAVRIGLQTGLISL
jgi:DNA-binding NarL/FixJ family response regulator